MSEQTWGYLGLCRTCDGLLEAIMDNPARAVTVGNAVGTLIRHGHYIIRIATSGPKLPPWCKCEDPPDA